MSHREIVIAPQSEGKGRTFRAACLTLVEADSLWKGGQTTTDDVRPVLAVLAGSENELRPFMVNLLAGRKAIFPSKDHSYRRKEDRVEVLRSSGFQVTWQREEEGSIATVFLPELFRLDPGMVDPAGAKFILLPTQEWASRQEIEVGSIVRHVRKIVSVDPKERDREELSESALAALVPLAFLFAAYLDRRTRCPILQDGRFYLQLLIACLREGLASWPSSDPYYSYNNGAFGVTNRLRFRVERADVLGYARGIAFGAGHPEIERVLAEQATLFAQVSKKR